MMDSANLVAGFADPPLQAQSVFRLVLDAMARPGRIKTLSDNAPTAPAPLDDAGFALALTLLDFETPAWLDPKLAAPDVVESLRFHCGCPIAEQAGAAAFALIGDASALPSFSVFDHGTPDYPDRAATLIVQAEGIAEGEGWTLTGPGIDGETGLRVLGLPGDFTGRWAANANAYPNGIDMIITVGRQLVCLPRTTKIEG
jgi:alpha-D-ribose 1-methylphosphonate 5-triphosphate synthase subunit PhnH